MQLVEQILGEMGADLHNSYTVVDGFGGYFRNVNGVMEYDNNHVTLRLPHQTLVVVGENLIFEHYFEHDLVIGGRITGVSLGR